MKNYMKNINLAEYGIIKKIENFMVVIFLYKSILSDYERNNLKLIGINLNDKKIIVFYPIGIKVENPIKNSINIALSKKYFKNIDAYNKIMMSYEFYKIFQNYAKKILVVQADVTIDKMLLEMDKYEKFPILGARWSSYISAIPVFGRRLNIIHGFWPISIFRKKLIYPNGGLSLRDVNLILKKLKYKLMNKCWFDSEDVYFSYIFDDELRVLYNEKIIDDFSQESMAKDNIYPGAFGYHALNKFNVNLL